MKTSLGLVDFLKEHTSSLSITFLILVILLPYWRLTTMQGLVVTDDIFTSDIMNESFPYRYYISEALKNGACPTWLPSIYGGIPLLARAEAGACYPLNLLLFGLLNPYVAVNLVILLTLMITAVGSFFLARELETGVIPSLVAAVSFAYSGFMVSHLKHLSTVGTVCWFPVGLFVIEHAIRRRQSKMLLWLAAVIALQNLSGHIQTAYYSGLVYLCYFGFRVLAERHREVKSLSKQTPTHGDAPWPFTRMAIVLFSVSVIVGVGISAVQLLPTYELVQLTQRSGGVSFAYAADYAYDPANVATFFYPPARGEISKATYSGSSIFWEDYGYVGLITVLLALYAVLKCWRTWHVRFYTIAAIVAYVLVLGPSTPVYGAVFSIVPGIDYFRFPTRFLFVVDASLALLAAFGLSKLQKSIGRSKGRSHTGQVAVAGSVVLILVVCDLLYFQMRQNAIGGAAEWSVPPQTAERIKKDKGLFRIYSPGSADMHKVAFAAARGWEGSLQPYLAQREFIQPSSNVLYGLFSADGYAQLTPTYLVDLWGDQNRPGLIMSTATFARGEFTAQPSFVRIMDMCNVKYILSPWPVRSGSLNSLGKTGPVFLYENPTVLPRAHLVGKYFRASSVESAKERILSGEFEPATEVILYESPHFVGDSLHSKSNVTVENYSTNEVIVAVSSDAAGLLVLSDTYYPGWKAEVDGRQVEILKANLCQRAVEVPAGTHTVRFHFDAPTIRIGAGISVATLMFLGVLLFVRLPGSRTPADLRRSNKSGSITDTHGTRVRKR